MAQDVGNAAAPIRTSVLIVGAGPSGLTASLLLRQYGVDALTVTRFPWTAHSPRAHHLNPRAMEILRGLGLEERLRARAMPGELLANVVWCVSLAGQELGRLTTYHRGGANGYRDVTPCEALNVQQHRFEPIMAEALLDRGGRLLFDRECLEIEQTDKGVTARIRDRATGAETIVEADYAIGADGANSIVARSLGLEFDGTEGWGAAINIWIEADLERFCAHRPGALYWTNLPGSDFWIGSGVFVAVEPWNEWMVTLMYDPRDGEPDITPAALRDRILRIIGDDDVAITIKSVGTWQMNALYAKDYGRGRIFCIGDAVHRHSPAGGLGANTGIIDAHNLAWKLRLVVEGVADPALLASYGAERQPIGRAVVERSMRNVEEFARIALALGYRPGQTEEQAEAELAKLAWPDADGERRRDALAVAVKAQAQQFNAIGFELDYRYSKGAIRGVAPDPADDSAGAPHVPRAEPGCAVPHAWLADRRGRAVSTRDIAAGGDFHLLTGLAGAFWESVCEEIGRSLGLRIVVDLIGPGGRFEDPYGEWRERRGIADSGCLLVRPDGHICWRRREADAGAKQALRDIAARLVAGSS